MKATVRKSYRNPKLYTVEVKHKHQSFRLDYEASRDECQWYADMFILALEAHDREKQKLVRERSIKLKVKPTV